MNFLLVLGVLAVTTLLSATGMLFLKMSSATFSIRPHKIIRNWRFITGGVLYGLSLILYLVVLKQLPVSLAYPLTSMNYVWVAILSMWFLKERVDAWRWGGVALIVVGIILLSL